MAGWRGLGRVRVAPASAPFGASRTRPSQRGGTVFSGSAGRGRTGWSHSNAPFDGGGMGLAGRGRTGWNHYNAPFERDDIAGLGASSTFHGPALASPLLFPAPQTHHTLNGPFFAAAYNESLLRSDAYPQLAAAHHSSTFDKGGTLLPAGQTVTAYYLIETGLVRKYIVAPRRPPTSLPETRRELPRSYRQFTESHSEGDLAEVNFLS